MTPKIVKFEFEIPPVVRKSAVKKLPIFLARSVALALAALVFSTPVQAEFFIDNFQVLDVANDASPTSLSSGISVEVSGPGVALDPSNDRYVFNAANIGDTFTVRYDWAGVFDDLQSISGLELDRLAIGAFFGDWSLTIDTGISTHSFGPALPTILTSPIALDNATELTFEFEYTGGSPIPTGGVGTWGGLSNPLFATPEPTGLLLLGSVGVVGLLQRRRRSAKVS